MRDYIIEIICIIITMILSVFAKKMDKLFTEKVKSDETRAVINTVVGAVEQICKDVHGAEKFEKACVMAVDILNDKGIKVKPDELRAMIEYAVNNLNRNAEGE